MAQLSMGKLIPTQVIQYYIRKLAEFVSGPKRSFPSWFLLYFFGCDLSFLVGDNAIENSKYAWLEFLL